MIDSSTSTIKGISSNEIVDKDIKYLSTTTNLVKSTKSNLPKSKRSKLAKCKKPDLSKNSNSDFIKANNSKTDFLIPKAKETSIH